MKYLISVLTAIIILVKLYGQNYSALIIPTNKIQYSPKLLKNGDTLVGSSINLRWKLISNKNNDIHIPIDLNWFNDFCPCLSSNNFIDKDIEKFEKQFSLGIYFNNFEDSILMKGIFVIENQRGLKTFYPHTASCYQKYTFYKFAIDPEYLILTDSNTFSANFCKDFLRVQNNDSIIRFYYLYRDHLDSSKIHYICSNWINIGPPFNWDSYTLQINKLKKQLFGEADKKSLLDSFYNLFGKSINNESVKNTLGKFGNPIKTFLEIDTDKKLLFYPRRGISINLNADSTICLIVIYKDYHYLHGNKNIIIKPKYENPLQMDSIDLNRKTLFKIFGKDYREIKNNGTVTIIYELYDREINFVFNPKTYKLEYIVLFKRTN